MTFTSLLVHDVTLIAPGTGAGRYGDAVKDWTTATEVDTKGWVARTGQNEVNGDREAQVSEWVLFLHPEETITGAYRVRWSGLTFEVDGPPMPAWTPRGEHHIEVPLRVVTG